MHLTLAHGTSTEPILGLKNLKRASNNPEQASQLYPEINGFRLQQRTGAPYGLSPEQQGRVLIVGGAFVDVTLGLAHMPVVGGDSYAKELNVGLGGCALNVAHILKQLQIPLDLKVPVGKGPYAMIVGKQLQEDGYEPLVTDPQHDCGYCLCMVDNDGERTFVVVPGVENHMQPEWFRDISLEHSDLIYISGFDITEENGECYLRHYDQKQPHTQIYFDAGARVDFITSESFEHLLSFSPILHLNRLELSLITKCSEAEEALQQLEQRCAGPIILSLDKDGCIVAFKGERVHFPVTPQPVTDATGAGDAHSAGIIAALMSGANLAAAIELGHRIACSALSQIGARIAVPQELHLEPFFHAHQLS